MPGAKYQYKIFLKRNEGYWDNFGANFGTIFDAAGLSWPLLQLCGKITDPILVTSGQNVTLGPPTWSLSVTFLKYKSFHF